MERRDRRERWLRPSLRGLLAAGAAVGVLLAPGLLPPSGASFSAATPITATSATDGPLVNGTAYTYRLRARHGSWVSPDATTTLTPSC